MISDQAEDVTLPVALGSGKRQQVEPRDPIAIRLSLRTEIGIPGDLLQEPLERRHEVRFNEHHQRNRFEQACIVGPHSAAHPVPPEKQARADHIYRASDDRGRRGIFELSSVVREFAAQRTDPELLVRAALLDTLRFRRGLIHDRPTVHNIDQTARSGAPAHRARYQSAITLVLPRAIGRSIASGNAPLENCSPYSRVCQRIGAWPVKRSKRSANPSSSAMPFRIPSSRNVPSCARGTCPPPSYHSEWKLYSRL
jgi:hypothetical protein